MKRLVSLYVACIMLLTLLAVPAFAEGSLPFELVPPGSVTAVWLEENDSPTTTAITYSLSNEMTSFFSNMEQARINDTYDEFMSGIGYDDFYMTTQVDWAVDDVNDSVSGWHYTEFWDGRDGFGLGYDDEGRLRFSCWDGVDYWIGNAMDTVNSHWIVRGVSEYDLNGDPDQLLPGLKDQLRPDQYTYRDDELFIDFNEHTMFFRMRFVVIGAKDTEEGTKNEFFYSDWSNIASIGKDAQAFTPLTKADLPAPVITGLRMTDEEFNDNPVVAFTLTVPDKLAADLTALEAFGGGISVETEARVKGDTEWTLMQNSDWTVRAGEMKSALISLSNEAHPNIPKDTEIELRCRYRCSQPDQEDFWSDYSKVISFGSDDINAGQTGYSEGTGEGQAEKDKCPICHFCSQPLGLCIFIWLAILIALIVIILIVLRALKKKRTK